MDSLSSRQKNYKLQSQQTLLNRVPLIIEISAKSFSRFCRNLKKPYEPLVTEALAKTMLYMVSEIPGTCFGYQSHDQIVLILRNDQAFDSEPWYNNNIQDIVSTTSSLATLGFNDNIADLDLNFIGDIIFGAKAWNVPNITETVNCLIWKQQDHYKFAISQATNYLLGKKYGRKTALKMINEISTKDKLSLIKEECGIDFDQEYPTMFKLGVGAYKIPMIIKDRSRKKWTIDWELSEFVENKTFVHNIITTGTDIFRQENLK